MEIKIRQEKVANEISKYASKEIRNLFPDRIVSVVRTEMSDGIKNANIFLSIFDNKRGSLFRDIKKNKRKIRDAIAKGLRIRKAPNIILILDAGMQQSQKISEIFNKLKESEK